MTNKQRGFYLISILFLGSFLVGCGGGGGGGDGAAGNPTAALTADEETLRLAMIGSWNHTSEQDDFGTLKAVHANSAGKFPNITFLPDGTGTAEDYSISTASGIGYYTTAEAMTETGNFSWVIQNGVVVTVSKYGTFTNTMRVEGNQMYQTPSTGGYSVWTRK